MLRFAYKSWMIQLLFRQDLYREFWDNLSITQTLTTLTYKLAYAALGK